MQDQIQNIYNWSMEQSIDVCLLGYDAQKSLLKVGSCLVVYYTGPQPDEEKIVATIRALIPWEPKRCFFKERYPQDSQRQYHPKPNESYGFWIREYDMQFWVDPGLYHDIGLFADQRKARRLIRSLSQGKRVLNLFCYTGGFSIAAALGGAKLVKSVDLSETYLTWAQKNWVANLPSRSQSVWLKRDVLEWLRSIPSDRFDLIIADPPTFSTSKKMRHSWDLPRDYRWLLKSCQRLLAPGGMIYFSTHVPAFSLDSEMSDRHDWKDVTDTIQTEDFPKNQIKAYIYTQGGNWKTFSVLCVV